MPIRRPTIMPPVRALCVVVLLAAARAAPAAEVTLNATDLVQVQPGLFVAPGVAAPPQDLSLPLVAPDLPGAAAGRLRTLVAEGRARGFAGVVYDNRDRGHSALRPDRFPRLARLAYGFELAAEDMDMGLAGAVVLPLVVLGNSSTAFTRGEARRSLVRHAMTRPGLPGTQARLYLSNHLYVYPEHRDHDAVDLYPANWPFTVTSQGSSGSDRPFLDALAMTLAAFREDTFARLAAEGLVAPTLQMILRRSLDPVRSDSDYLSPRAHPVVFDAGLLRPERMVEAAAALAPDEIPPVVRLEVVTEDFRSEAGLAGLDERLFDTPFALARIWRGPEWEREMVLSAAATVDPNGRPLTFSWHLLQGLPERVEIVPLDAMGRTARVRVRWHDPFAVVQAGLPRVASRVDIGVFASNGASVSAPALVSISFPTHELRTYAAAADGTMRLVSVDRDAAGRQAAFDPLLHWSAPWTDVAVHEDGRIVAWDRRDAAGGVRRVPAEGPGYRIDRNQEPPVLVEVPPVAGRP